MRFVNRAVIRRFRGATLADETAGSLITYDNAAEVFSVSGGTSAATPANPSGRVRAVLTPRDSRAQRAGQRRERRRAAQAQRRARGTTLNALPSQPPARPAGSTRAGCKRATAHARS